MPVTQVYTATQILNVVFGRVYDQDNVYAHPARNIDTVEFETQLNSQSGALVVVLRIHAFNYILCVFGNDDTRAIETPYENAMIIRL